MRFVEGTYKWLDSKSEEELTTKLYLTKVLKAVSSFTGIINRIQRSVSYSDYPKIWQYESILSHTSTFSDGDTNEAPAGYGTSLKKSNALVRSIGEAFDRYASSIYHANELKIARSNDLKSKLDLNELAGFSHKQLKDLKECRFDENSIFRWTKGYSLKTNKNIYIPAQLVYMPYIYLEDEPILRLPITTGIASGSSFLSAFYRALGEVIERDAFMIRYLNKAKTSLISLNKLNHRNREYIKKLESYGLEIKFFDLSLDIPIPIIGAVTIDKNSKMLGDISLFQFGAASDFNVNDAMIKALEESLQGLYWVRLVAQTEPHSKIDDIRRNPNDIVDHLERALFWLKDGSIKDLEFFWNGGVIDYKHKYEKNINTYRDKLKVIIKYLLAKGYDIIVKDMTPSDIKSLGVTVVKVIVPELQPLHLFEKYKCLGGERLYELPIKMKWTKTRKNEEDLNSIPHPFL
ncbi:MAG: YcaO-like family protein [Caldisphaera sp.]